MVRYGLITNLADRDAMTNHSQTVSQADEEQEEIEGYESEEGTLGEYPIDTMLIRNENRTVHDVLRRIDQGNFIMDPDFQRDFIWDPDKQSKLIESVLMRIPLPVFYVAENEDGRMVVVDGLQRLSTFKNFVSGNLALRLSKRPQLDKRRFDELSPKLQNRIEDCNLTFYIIDSKAPDRARLDIFERVNGGDPLTRQQMRNCLYMGRATRFLKEEAAKVLFKEATGGSLSVARMRDREFVNRFCGFQLLSLDDYRGNMDDFLATTLTKMNKLGQPELQELSNQLQMSLSNNKYLFGHHSFRKHYEWQVRRNPISASLWDVMTTGLSRYGEYEVRARTDEVKDAFYKLLNNREFIDAITIGTNQTNKVKARFELTRNMFKEVFGADST